MPEIISPEEVLDAFKQAGALLEGHFILASGRHSAQYLEKALVLQYPGNVERMCRDLARRFEGSKPDLVIGPTTLGVVLSYEVAKHLGVRSLFAEREGEGFALRRGFRIEPGQRVLVVDDILTTGGSVRDVVDAVERLEGEIIGIGVLVDRSTQTIRFNAPVESLLRMEVETYAPEECPLCRQGLPPVKPGTTPQPGSKSQTPTEIAPAL